MTLTVEQKRAVAIAEARMRMEQNQSMSPGERAAAARDTLPATARWLGEIADRGETIEKMVSKLQWRHSRENWIRQGFNGLTEQYETIVKEATELTLRHMRGTSNLLEQLDKGASPLEKAVIRLREPTRKLRRDFRKLNANLSQYGEGALSPVEKALGRGFKSVDDAVAKFNAYGTEAGEALAQLNDVLVEVTAILDDLAKHPRFGPMIGRVLDGGGNTGAVAAFDDLAKLAGKVRDVDVRALARTGAARVGDRADDQIDWLLGPKGGLRRQVTARTGEAVTDASAVFNREADRLLEAGRRLDRRLLDVITNQDADLYRPINGEFGAWYERVFSPKAGRAYLRRLDDARDQALNALDPARREAFQQRIVERIQPVGQAAIAGRDNSGLRDPGGVAPAAMAAAPATTDRTVDLDGEAVYKAACTACHGAGIAGAPKTGDQGAWAARLEQGMDTLVEHAIKGFQGQAGYMPARGGHVNLTDEQVRDAVQYMVDAI
jgi:cytochrome c5